VSSCGFDGMGQGYDQDRGLRARTDEVGLLNLSPRVGTAGLVGLVALNVVVVAMALRSTHTIGTDTSPVGSRSTSSAGATETPSSPSPASPATATATATRAPAAPLLTLLVAIDNQRAWRVSVGSCTAGGAALATTTDGGKTWVDAKTPLRTIVRVRPDDGRSAFVVGAGSGCAAELKSTTDGGDSWGSTSIVGSAWFRDPKNPSAVGSPGSSTSRPCGVSAVLDLAVLSADAARVLCADGRVRSTTSAGSSWADSGKVTAAVALSVSSADPAQTYVARVGVPDCPGIQIQRVDQSVATSCIHTVVPTDPGQIALSLVKGGGWLAIGHSTMRSTDELVSWSAS